MLVMQMVPNIKIQKAGAYVAYVVNVAARF